MDIHVLKTFIAVCEYSGFSAAAKKLGYTQSTVSSQIRQLEKELNVSLFDRFYHKIKLTSDCADQKCDRTYESGERLYQLLSDRRDCNRSNGCGIYNCL